MIDSVSKALFHSIAGSRRLKSLASRYGMRQPRSFARRFIAGETVEEAIAAAREVEALGMTQTLDYLGESVASMAEADQATRAYLADHRDDRGSRNRPQRLVEADAARADGRSRDVGRQSATRPRRRDEARFLRSGRHGELGLHRRHPRHHRDNVAAGIPQCGRRAAVVSQAQPGRCTAHESAGRASATVQGRVQGATKRRLPGEERTSTPPSSRIMKCLLTDGAYPAIATHDPAMIQATLAFAESTRIAGGSLGVPDALRHPSRPAVGARRGGLPRANLHSVRTGMVPVLHAAARRAARKHRFRPQKSGQRTVKSLPAAGAPPTASCIKAPIARRSADARVWFKPPTISSGPS